jgi:hypothetical protein
VNSRHLIGLGGPGGIGKLYKTEGVIIHPVRKLPSPSLKPTELLATLSQPEFAKHSAGWHHPRTLPSPALA